MTNVLSRARRLGPELTVLASVTRGRFRRPRQLVVSLVVAAMTLVGPTGSAAAQYGGLSGLFVTPSDEPGVADFDGLGCAGGDEVVLYMPGIDPTPNDPVASQSVPGRILAVTTAVSSDDPLIDGTFEFPSVVLPDLPPGVYEVRARCGSVDMRVLIEIGDNGMVNTNPDPDAEVINPLPPDQLPLTGGDPSRLVSFAGLLLAVGVIFLAAGRRRHEPAHR